MGDTSSSPRREHRAIGSGSLRSFTDELPQEHRTDTDNFDQYHDSGDDRTSYDDDINSECDEPNERKSDEDPVGSDPSATSLSPEVVSLLKKLNYAQSPRFYELSPEHRFTHLSALLANWTAADPILHRKRQLQKMPLGTLMSLCLNDHFATLNKPATDGMTMYFALRAWTPQEVRAWEGWSPLSRLVVSGVFHPFQWSRGDTLVVPIQVIQQSLRHGKNRNSRLIQRFCFDIPGTDLLKARKVDRKMLLLLVLPDARLIAVGLNEVLRLPVVRDPTDESGEMAGPMEHQGPVIARRVIRGMEDGMIRVALLLQPSSQPCSDWVESHMLPADSMETTLYERCRNGILDEDTQGLARQWSELYDEAMVMEDQSKAQLERSVEQTETDDAGATTKKISRWTTKQDDICHELLSDGTRLGLDDETAIAEASRRLLDHGYKRSPEVIGNWFYKSGNEWKSVNRLRGTPQRREWTTEEENAMGSILTKLDSSLPMAERAFRVAKELTSTYGFERTPAQVISRWCENPLLRQSFTPASLGTPSRLPVSQRLSSARTFATTRIHNDPGVREREGYNSEGTSLFTPQSSATTPSLAITDRSPPLSRLPLSRRLFTSQSPNDSTSSSHVPLQSNIAVETASEELPRLENNATPSLAAGLCGVSGPAVSSDTLDDLEVSFALDGQPLTMSYWSREEEEVCIKLMSEVETDLSISDALEEVSVRMREQYGYDRSPRAVLQRWYLIRPDDYKSVQIFRFHDWKPEEDEALRTLLVTFENLPLFERYLEISKSMKAIYGFDRSAKGVSHRAGKLLRNADTNHHGDDAYADDEQQGRAKASCNDAAAEDVSNDDSVVNDKVQSRSSTLASPNTAPLLDLETTDSHIDTFGKHRASTYSSNNADGGYENETANAEPKEVQRGGMEIEEVKRNKSHDKKTSTSTWTDAEYNLCQSIRAQVKQSPAFSTKGLDTICDEVARRVQEHGYTRTGRAIRNHLHKVEKAARQASGLPDTEPRPRWTPEKRAALTSLMEEHSTVTDLMQRFQTVAERMRSDFGYPCTATQVKSQWYGIRRKNK
ncbi:hypothetical protein KCU95_g3199, partial [Aureobasidium melanogenum]